MTFLDTTFPTPEENLACDDALLDACEEDGSDEVLRVWEPSTAFVVLGYSNRASREVDLEHCRSRGVPVLRRVSGGGAVLQGPGCLCYALVLRVTPKGDLATIPGANRYVMQRHAQMLCSLTGKNVEMAGTSDLAIGMRKCSGNSQRRKGNFLLYHGSFLLSLDISLVEEVLPMPSDSPSYRAGRPHADFLLNLRLDPSALKGALRKTWRAAAGASLPVGRIRRLVSDRYSQERWNLRR
jgi:lipoate-protein ligase A